MQMFDVSVSKSDAALLISSVSHTESMGEPRIDFLHLPSLFCCNEQKNKPGWCGMVEPKEE